MAGKGRALIAGHTLALCLVCPVGALVAGVGHAHALSPGLRCEELTKAVPLSAPPDSPPPVDTEPSELKTEEGSSPTSVFRSDSTRYGFESEDIFWKAQTYKDSKAVTGVVQSRKGMAKLGQYSLELAIDLVGGHPNKSKGEAFVDLRFFPPTGVEAPVDLDGVLITAWVFAPDGAEGDPDSPNGIHLFVKDNHWRSEYGTWFDLIGFTDRWVPVRLTPRSRKPSLGYMDAGFRPDSIIMIGVKVGAGGKSTATYKGPVYLDAVDW